MAARHRRAISRYFHRPLPGLLFRGAPADGNLKIADLLSIFSHGSTSRRLTRIAASITAACLEHVEIWQRGAGELMTKPYELTTDKSVTGAASVEITQLTNAAYCLPDGR